MRIHLVAAFLLFGAVTLHAQTPRWSYGHVTSFMGEQYSQHIYFDEDDPYPEWNPAEELCPLPPTNALFLAKEAASKAFADVKTWELSSLSLHMEPNVGVSGIWYYQVILSPQFGGNRPEKVTCLSILVGLDGRVPEIKKTGQLSDEPATTNRVSYAERRRQRLAELEKRRKKMADAPGVPEELEKKLQEYQMELIRQGNPPLPIPLTKEMDDELVKEGVLPPAKQDDATVPQETGQAGILQPGPRNPGLSEGREWVSSIGDKIYGKRYWTRIVPEDIESSPDFDPEGDNWPLSPHDAVEKARQWMQKSFTEEPAWVLDDLGISRIMKTRKWKYAVKFRNGDESGDHLGDTVFTVHVLMDGRVLEPEPGGPGGQDLDIPDPPPPLKTLDDTEPRRAMRFNNADIQIIAETYEELTGWKVIADADIKLMITIFPTGIITEADAARRIEHALAGQGIALEKASETELRATRWRPVPMRRTPKPAEK